jgi:adenosylcobinamide kinase/adenosylcobinamide-phosphate guanylyltransferase
VTPRSLLLLGGARSGKSRYALAAAAAPGFFIATARPDDPDMARRIERHRRDRGPAWHTIEEPVALAATLESLAGERQSVVVDCLTLWVSNRQLAGASDDEVLAETDRIARLVAGHPFELVFVSNEVGGGVHPETQAGLRFRDLLGTVNQQLAAAVDRVVLMVAGLPLSIKDDRGAARDVAAQPAP